MKSVGSNGTLALLCIVKVIIRVSDKVTAALIGCTGRGFMKTCIL